MTTTTTTTRRGVLAGSAALPALALPALALPAAAETDDPAVAAFHRFVPALRRWEAAAEVRGHMTDFGPDVDHAALALADAEQDAASELEMDAIDALASAEATTAEGIRCQYLGLLCMVALLHRDGERLEPEDYDFGNCFGPEDRDLANRMARGINRSLLRLAGRAGA